MDVGEGIIITPGIPQAITSQYLYYTVSLSDNFSVIFKLHQYCFALFHVQLFLEAPCFPTLKSDLWPSWILSWPPLPTWPVPILTILTTLNTMTSCLNWNFQRSLDPVCLNECWILDKYVETFRQLCAHFCTLLGKYKVLMFNWKNMWEVSGKPGPNWTLDKHVLVFFNYFWANILS